MLRLNLNCNVSTEIQEMLEDYTYNIRELIYGNYDYDYCNVRFRINSKKNVTLFITIGDEHPITFSKVLSIADLIAEADNVDEDSLAARIVDECIDYVESKS